MKIHDADGSLIGYIDVKGVDYVSWHGRLFACKGEPIGFKEVARKDIRVLPDNLFPGYRRRRTTDVGDGTDPVQRARIWLVQRGSVIEVEGDDTVGAGDAGFDWILVCATSADVARSRAAAYDSESRCSYGVWQPKDGPLPADARIEWWIYWKPLDNGWVEPHERLWTLRAAEDRVRNGLTKARYVRVDCVLRGAQLLGTPSS